MLKYTLVFILYSIITIANSARILGVFLAPSKSFNFVFNALTQELVKNGHEVVAITSDPAFVKAESPKNLTEIDIHDVSYKFWLESYKYDAIGEKSDLFEQMKFLFDSMTKLFEIQLQVKEVNDIILKKNGIFDLLLLDAFVTPSLIFSHIYKVPTIQISTMGDFMFTNDVAGVPMHPLLYPTPWSQKIYNRTKWEKTQEIYNFFWLKWHWTSFEKDQDMLLKRIFGPDVPSLSELNKDVDMWFLNTYNIWADNQPLPPNVVYLGGLQLQPPKPLPKDLQSYLDSSKNGVIYVSFGTNVQPHLLQREKVEAILKVLSELPYDILLKWNTKKIGAVSKNIKVSDWYPQSDLLMHPKIKLFINQCGLQSTDEAIRAGVPVLGIPMFTDQWFNGEKYAHHKIGLALEIDTLTEEKLRNAINTVLYDDSYRKNIIKLRTIVQDQPQTSLERAVWWIEYLLRHGNANHLRPPSANISWAEYIELELILIVLTFILIMFAGFIMILYYCSKLFSNPHRKIKLK